MKHILFLSVGFFLVPLVASIVGRDYPAILRPAFGLYVFVLGTVYMLVLGKRSGWRMLIVWVTYLVVFIATIWAVPEGLISGEIWFLLLMLFFGTFLWVTYKR